MSTKRRAAPADEVRGDDAGNAADGKNTDDANTQVAKDEEGSFLDILGIGDQPEEGGAADDQGGGEGGDDQAGDQEPVQKAEKAKDVLGKLTPILQKLTGAVTKAKDLGDKPLTPEITKAIDEVVKALQGFGGKAEEGDGDADDKDKKEKADAGALATAVSKLTAIVETVKKAGDGDAPKDIAAKLANIAKALEGFLAKQSKGKADTDADDDKDKKGKDKDKKKDDAKGKTEKAFEVYKAAGTEDDDPEVIIKAGAKMKRSRLSQLKKAVETLATLISELEGDANGGGKEKATKSEVDLSPVMNRIDEFASAVKSRFEALEEKADAVNKRVENIENTRPAGNGEGDPDPVQKSDDENFWAGVL